MDRLWTWTTFPKLLPLNPKPFPTSTKGSVTTMKMTIYLKPT
jgi:hypothetical protein